MELSERLLNREVYRDKDTMVEVTVHKKSKSFIKQARNKPKTDKAIIDIKTKKVSKKDQEQSKDYCKLEEENKDNTKHSDNRDREIKIQTLENDCRRYKDEAAKFRTECQELLGKLEVGKDVNSSLEEKIVELTYIIKRLTKNNGDLLAVVSEKFDFDNIVINLEEKMVFLYNQLKQEKELSSFLKQKLETAEAEVVPLRSLKTNVLAELRHGLGGLELPRLETGQFLSPVNLSDVSSKDIHQNCGGQEDASFSLSLAEPLVHPLSTKLSRQQMMHSMNKVDKLLPSLLSSQTPPPTTNKSYAPTPKQNSILDEAQFKFSEPLQTASSADKSSSSADHNRNEIFEEVLVKKAFKDDNWDLNISNVSQVTSSSSTLTKEKFLRGLELPLTSIPTDMSSVSDPDL